MRLIQAHIRPLSIQMQASPATRGTGTLLEERREVRDHLHRAAHAEDNLVRREAQVQQAQVSWEARLRARGAVPDRAGVQNQLP